MRGVFHHNIDAKGRLSFPVKFRDALGTRFILSKGLNQCLWAMTEEDFETLEDKLEALPIPAAAAQKLQYHFAANFDVEADGQGRILVPPELRTFAGLQKEITFIGFKGRVEIWDTALWRAASEMPGGTALELLGDARLL